MLSPDLGTVLSATVCKAGPDVRPFFFPQMYQERQISSSSTVDFYTEFLQCGGQPRFQYRFRQQKGLFGNGDLDLSGRYSKLPGQFTHDLGIEIAAHIAVGTESIIPRYFRLVGIGMAEVTSHFIAPNMHVMLTGEHLNFSKCRLSPDRFCYGKRHGLMIDVCFVCVHLRLKGKAFPGESQF